MRQKVLREALVPKPSQPLTQQQLRFRLTWAALIRLVYEVDPLKCPACGGTMTIVALIDHDRQPHVVENILKHCKLWKEPMQRGPLPVAVADSQSGALTYDPGYFDQTCA